MSFTTTYAIGRDRTVGRLGYGALRLCGPGFWGDPVDRDDPDVPSSDQLGELDALRQEGKIRHIGAVDIELADDPFEQLGQLAA